MAPLFANAVVLAGGRGERLQSVVSDVPKPMAPVHGRPFLAYVLDNLVDAGLKKITLSVGYRGEVIQEHFGASYRTVRIRYSWEREPLGTGGALALALKGESASPVLVLNGDTLVRVNMPSLAEWAHALHSLVGVVLCPVPDISRYGAVVVSEDRIVEFKEKERGGSGLVNAGMYILQPSIFSLYQFEKKWSFETDLLQPYCSQLQPQCFVTTGYFIDIGTPADYARAQKELEASR